jgi:predicted component of type VI protein secretion system
MTKKNKTKKRWESLKEWHLKSKYEDNIYPVYISKTTYKSGKNQIYRFMYESPSSGNDKEKYVRANSIEEAKRKFKNGQFIKKKYL